MNDHGRISSITGRYKARKTHPVHKDLVIGQCREMNVSEVEIAELLKRVFMK